jgi:hypothetical protein
MRSVAVVLLLATSLAHADAPAPATTRSFSDSRCPAAPAVRPAGFRHHLSHLIARLGPSNHRGIDVIALDGDKVQRIAGKLAYSRVDKDLEGEDVEVFACIDQAWRSVGTARTDEHGRFAMTLEGSTRLPLGMRDLYVASLGDATGAWFAGYVAAHGTGVVVTDIDGTITSSENAIVKQVVAGSDVEPRPHAADALASVAFPIVYVTSRGDVFTELTRRWLERHNFPRGLLRMSAETFAKPGNASIEHKTATLRALAVPIVAGIGNRSTDITAYASAGVAANRILIHLPEYEQEVRAALAAHDAVGFSDYLQLPTLLTAP